jgi:hypothetical protein
LGWFVIMMSYIHETNTHARAQAKTLGIQIWYQRATPRCPAARAHWR